MNAFIPATRSAENDGPTFHRVFFLKAFCPLQKEIRSLRDHLSCEYYRGVVRREGMMCVRCGYSNKLIAHDIPALSSVPPLKEA
ncbi:MAG: hypothetical protein D6795_12235 [Deltaproteobacteria bacterium]|nr:MAG: hypothetical protein D6795_12235 [Deltaproteobacteria bacterium]